MLTMKSPSFAMIPVLSASQLVVAAGDCAPAESLKAPLLKQRTDSDVWGWFKTYPLVMTNVAIENDHRNSGFTH